MKVQQLHVLRYLAGIVILVGMLWVLPSPIDGASPTQTVGPQSVERLVIQYNQGSFELISRTPLRKTLPPSVTLPAPIGQVRGSWFEVQSTTGEMVYRRRFPAPNVIYTEWPTQDDPTQLRREEIEVSENVFTILVPKNDKAEALLIFGTPRGQDKRAAAAGEIGRLQLR